RRRHLGPHQPARAAVDPPRRNPREDPRPPGPPPLTRGSVGLDVAPPQHPVSTVEPRIATLPPPDQRRASTSMHRGFTRRSHLTTNGSWLSTTAARTSATARRAHDKAERPGESHHHPPNARLRILGDRPQPVDKKTSSLVARLGR